MKNFLDKHEGKILGVFVIITIILATVLIIKWNTEKANAETITEETEETVVTETETVHVLCNVIEHYESLIPIYDKYGNFDDYTWGTVLICKMQNGEIHKYGIQDPPEGRIDIACFETENLDDYSTYKVATVASYENLYAKVAIITEIKDNTVIATCVNGKQFKFSPTDDWMVGDFINMLIYDNDTENNINDDMVISTTYDGHITMFEEILK